MSAVTIISSTLPTTVSSGSENSGAPISSTSGSVSLPPALTLHPAHRAV